MWAQLGDSRLAGSRFTADEKLVADGFVGLGWREGGVDNKDCDSQGGQKTQCTWQECWWHLRRIGSLVKLGIHISPATLFTMLGLGHGSDVVDSRTCAISERSSRVSSVSDGRSFGISISIKSPGHRVVEVADARRTTARWAVWQGLWLTGEP